jgi:hypothetical protein
LDAEKLVFHITRYSDIEIIKNRAWRSCTPMHTIRLVLWLMVRTGRTTEPGRLDGLDESKTLSKRTSTP